MRLQKKNLKRMSDRIVELERTQGTSRMYLEHIYHKLEQQDVHGMANRKGQIIMWRPVSPPTLVPPSPGSPSSTNTSHGRLYMTCMIQRFTPYPSRSSQMRKRIMLMWIL